MVADLSTVDIVSDDDELWTAQRAGQRSDDGVVVKVSGRLTELPFVISAARANEATVASRAGLGLSWLRFPSGPSLAEQVAAARTALAPRHCVALDGAGLVDNPGLTDPALVALTSRVKERFDPVGLFRPGAFGGN
jgi:glycolate oxidase FAD binding subunit